MRSSTEPVDSPFLTGEILPTESGDWKPDLTRLLGESPFVRTSIPAQIVAPDESRDGEFFDDEDWDEEVFEDQSAGPSPLDALSPSELKAVRITSTFETGRAGSFSGLTGNFDGQGVSFGLMNFAWKAGSLLTLLKAFLRDHPVAFAEVFAPDAERFQEVVLATKVDPENPKRQERDIDRQMEFARNVLNDASKNIREPWRSYFGRLEVNPHFRRIQVEAVRRAVERARYWCQYFGLSTERSFVFMFDLVSSHGGAWLNARKFKGRRRAVLRAMLKKKKGDVGRNELTEIETLEVIANMIADVSDERWRKKVRARKLWFVKGSGTVHGKSWDLAKDFGVTDALPNFDREEPEQGPFADHDEAEDPEQWTPNDEAQDEPEEFSGVADEALNGEEDEVTNDHESESYVCSPYVHELQQGELGKSESSLDEPYLDEEEDETVVELENEVSNSPLVSYDARIITNRARTGTRPAEVALIIDRWGIAENVGVNGVRLKVYECDIGEAGRSDSQTASNVQMAEFTFDLDPNPEFVNNPAKVAVPRVLIAKAKWANETLENSYRATKKPDIVLRLGNRAFPLWIPREDILEEGNAAEIGILVEDREGHRVERTSIALGHVARVLIPDYLKVILDIPGRFDDPKRDAALDVDGTKFNKFLSGKSRRQFITKWLDEHSALKEAANEPNADLKTSDIIKAWFIIHDVGVKVSDDKRFMAKQTATKNNAVHGFLNRAGYYAATHDFTKNRQGTVYEFLSKYGRKYVNGYTINIETVPDIEAGVQHKPDGSRGDASNADQYASIGYRRTKKQVTYYKWTKTAFDTLADLYIFASARARHLLTITVHKEVDRNLGRSVIWREYSAAEMRAGKGKHWATVRDHPSNYHGDPYGFDVQALYDLITQKLNALGGRKVPVGARYGIHPRRVTNADGQDIANGDRQLHQFPHQSDPNVKTDAGLKKTGWWNS